MPRSKLNRHARSALYALAGLLVPGGVPFGLVDREHPAAESIGPEA
ncbi:hypothetical protein [Salinisphaera sp. PC39]